MRIAVWWKPALPGMKAIRNVGAAGNARWSRIPYTIQVALVLLVVGAATLLYGDDYVTAVGVSVLTYGMLGLGLTIVVGYAGLLDLGYAAFFAIGAYTCAILTTDFHASFWVTLPFSVAFAGIAGTLLGYPTLRLRSDYLAIVTLGFGEIVRVMFQNWDYVGGPNGVWNIPAPSLFGKELYSQPDFFVIGLVLVGIALVFGRNLAYSRLGRGWLALREDEFAAEAVGVPTLRVKLLAYTMGGMWAGLAGAFFASRLSAINPTSFSFVLSSTILILIVIGGLGSLNGVLLGSIVVVALPEFLRFLQTTRFLFYAVALVVLMLFRPQGLWPDVRRKVDPWLGLEGHSLAAFPGHRQGGAARIGDDEPILTIDRLTHSFGGLKALDGLSLEIRRGAIFSIIGPNGAGKTTVFNCVTGIYRPREGSIRFLGRSLVGSTPHRVVALGMARTFQGIRLFKQMAVYENVMTGLYSRQRAPAWQSLLHLPAERHEERQALLEARFWLSFVGLESDAGKLASELSYADQRRLEIARALAAGPQLLLLDEPAAGMNPTEKLELVLMVRRIRALGITVVLIDHDMGLVMKVSDRVAVLDQGKVIAEGAPAEIQESQRVIDAYLGREADDELDDDETFSGLGA